MQIHLSPTEFDLLAYLMQNPGLPMDNNKLLSAIWEFSNDKELDYVVQHYISRFRRKIEDNINTPAYLLTGREFGYRFCIQSHVAHNATVACGDWPATSPSSSVGRSAKENTENIPFLSLRRLRKAIQSGCISFPSQVPVFARESRSDIQWRLVELYFVRNWSCSDLGERYGVTMERVRQLLSAWVRRAVLIGYLQEIPTESRLALRSSGGGSTSPQSL